MPTAPLAGCHSSRRRVRHLRDTVCTSATERHAALLSAHVFPDSCLLGPLPAPRGPGFELGQGLVRGMPGDSRGGSVQRPGGVRGQRPGAGCGRRDRSFQTRREDGRVGADGERVAGAGTGFRARFSRGFCFVLEGRGRPWPRRAARRRWPGQRPGGVATLDAERLRSGGRTHREGHPSGPTACPSVPRRPLPGPFRGPGWGAGKTRHRRSPRDRGPQTCAGGSGRRPPPGVRCRGWRGLPWGEVTPDV